MKTTAYPLTVFFLVLALISKAQDSLRPHEVLDLSQVETTIQHLNLPNGEQIAFVACPLDWEQVIYEAAAVLALKKILLPQKEILFSYALTLRVLQRQPESLFYHRPTTYSKFLTPFLTEEENEYLQAQFQYLDSLNQPAMGIEMGLHYLENTGKAHNYEILADSLIARAYRLPYTDPLDLEAVLRAKWARAYEAENKLSSAIYQQQQVYNIRKERKDRLSYSFVPLAEWYEKTGQQDKVLNLYRDVLAEVEASSDKNEEINGPSFWRIVAFFATVGEVEESIKYFERWAFKIPENLSSIWDQPAWIPYALGIQSTEEPAIALNLAMRWVTQLRKHHSQAVTRSKVVPILELLKRFRDKAVVDFMQSVFEEFYFPDNYNFDWQESNANYWFWVVPYQRVLREQTSVAKKQAILQRWMELALRTNNHEIIRETAFHVAYDYAKIEHLDLADAVFVNHYCANLLTRSQDKQAWFDGSPYSRAFGDKTDYWYNRWIFLAKKHASPELQVRILAFVARKYYDQGRYAESVRFREEILALHQQQGDLRKQEYSIYHLISLYAAIEEDYLGRIRYIIELYELQIDHNQFFNIDYSLLESAFASYKSKKLSKKDKKKLLTRWKQWANQLDKTEDQQANLRMNLERLIRLFENGYFEKDY